MSESKNGQANILVVIPRANITKLFHAEKSGRDYLTISDGESELNISSGDLDLHGVPLLVPCRIEAEIMAFLYGKNQMLVAKSFKALPL